MAKLACKTIAVFALAIAACGGGNKPAPAAPEPTAGSSTGSAEGAGSGSSPMSGPCTSDADCGDGKRCDSCPSTCPPGTEVCAAVCGAPVCVPK